MSSKSTNQHRLAPFFAPQRIAFVGASERGAYPAGVLQNLQKYGYQGEIYPVNPKRDTVFNLKCYSDITQVPEVPDLAILTIPRQFVIPTIKQCIEMGVPAALVISAGFREADAEGKALQKELEEILKNKPMAVIGPNCAGLASINDHVIATRLPAAPKTGPVSFVSQSGAFMMALHGVFSDRQIGMNLLVSLGNQVDVTIPEALDYLIQDEGTRVISLFLEGMSDGKALADGFKRSLVTGKPVVLIKSGRTQAGQKAAATHTAALAGESRVFEAICDQFGAILVDDVNEMMDTIQVMAAFGEKLSRGKRVALVSQSGGLGSLTADLVEVAGLEAPALSAALESKLRELPTIPDYAVLLNPADVRGASVRGEMTEKTLDVFLEDDDYDAVVLLLAKSAVRDTAVGTAKAIVRAAENHNKPLVVVWVGQRQPTESVDWELGFEIINQAGIPMFDQSSNAVKALARAMDYWQFRADWLSDPEVIHG
jgi:acyl-CoA synthetase (NDP forming)